MLLFAACCRFWNHTVFTYAPEAFICGCPSWQCKSLRGVANPSGMWKYWNWQAESAKNDALAMWAGFRK